MSKSVGRVIASPLSIIDKGLSKTLLQITAVVAPFFGPVGAAIAAGAAITLKLFYGPKSQKAEQSEASIKTPRPPRVGAAGRVKLFGAYILFETSTDGTAADVWAFHEGRIARICRYYLNDDPVRLVGGVVQEGKDKRYWGNTIRVGANLGLPVETAHAAVSALVPAWGADHRGDGIVSGYMLSDKVKAKNFGEIYPQGGPNNTPLAIVIEPVYYDWRDPTQNIANPATWKFTTNPIVFLANYQLFQNGKTWARHFAPTLAYWTAAADDCDVATPVRYGQAITMADMAKGVGSMTLDNVSGITNGMTLTFASTGEAVTVSGVAGQVVSFAPVTDNAYAMGEALGWQSATSFEPRYRIAMSYKFTDERKAVIGSILATCDGWMQARSDGALVVYSGRYYAPTVSIGPDDIINYSFQDGVNDENRVTDFIVSYVSAAHDYNSVECDPWIIDDTTGYDRPQGLDNQVPSHGQARRLAKRTAQKVAAPYKMTVTTNSGGRPVIGQRFINLRLVEAEGTELEFIPFEGPVEITSIRRNFGSGGVTFVCVSADPNVDVWNAATEEGLPAPAGVRVARDGLVAPTIDTAVPQYGADVGAGTTGVFIELDVTGPDQDDLIWFIRTRIVGAPVWGEREYSDIDPGPTVTLVTEFVPTDESIEVQVQYQTGDGRYSEWSATTTVSTSTASIGPAAPTDLAATPGAAGVANVTWRNPSSTNFSYCRLYRNTVNTFGTATQVGGNIVGGLGAIQNVSDTGLPAGTKYYWVRAFTAAGVASTVTGPVTVVVT